MRHRARIRPEKTTVVQTWIPAEHLPRVKKGKRGAYVRMCVEAVYLSTLKKEMAISDNI
jgi:hypothetical protein